MGYATHLVTLAHRVSGVHARYAKIHSSSFAFSFGKFVARLGRKDAPEFCRYQSKLADLEQELTQITALMNNGSAMQPSTTLGDEFILVLKEYIAALSETIQCLGRICDALCREKRGVGAYDENRSRADRVAYDESIQRYRRLGERLSHLYQRL